MKSMAIPAAVAPAVSPSIILKPIPVSISVPQSAAVRSTVFVNVLSSSNPVITQVPVLAVPSQVVSIVYCPSAASVPPSATAATLTSVTYGSNSLVSVSLWISASPTDRKPTPRFFALCGSVSSMGVTPSDRYPVWNLSLVVPSINGVPFHSVSSTILSISVRSSSICFLIASRSATPSASFAACSDLSLTTRSMSLILVRPASATESKFLASPMLSSATPRPRLFALNLVAIVRPAGSSAASLILLPVARRNWWIPSFVLTLLRALSEFKPAMFDAIRVISACAIL